MLSVMEMKTISPWCSILMPSVPTKKTDEHDEELEEQEQLLESVLDNMDEG